MDIVRTALLLLSAYSPALKKSFHLIRGHVKSEHCQRNKFYLTQKREIKVVHDTNFSQNREI